MKVIPEILYFFVMLTGPTTQYPVHRPLWITTDGEACARQAQRWNEIIAPAKPTYFCLPHAPRVLLELNEADR